MYNEYVYKTVWYFFYFNYDYAQIFGILLFIFIVKFCKKVQIHENSSLFIPQKKDQIVKNVKFLTKFFALK